MPKDLTPKQKRFCDEYLIDLNGTQAAIRSGYSKRTANEQAAQLLAKLSIQQYIREKQSKIANKLEITQERILKEYARIAFSDIRNYFDDNNRLRPLNELDEDAAAALSSMEVDELWGMSMDGKVQIGDTKKIKVWDKKGALDSICKVLGYNATVKQDITTQGKSIAPDNDKIEALLKKLQ